MSWSLLTSTTFTCEATTATSSGMNITGADFIVVNVGWYSGGGSITIGNSKSDTVNALTAHTGGDWSQQLFYIDHPTIDAAYTINILGSASLYASIEVLVFSGSAASPFDQQTGANNGSTKVSSQATGSLTASQDGCLYVTGTTIGAPASEPTVTIDSSFNTPLTVPYGAVDGSSISWFAQTTAGAKNPTWSFSVDSGAPVGLAVFKGSGGGGSAKNQFYYNQHIAQAA